MSTKLITSRKYAEHASKTVLVVQVDPTECPYREFKDNELHSDLWGLGPAACRATLLMGKSTARTPADRLWVDEQIQPLPRSVRQILHGWVRAEQLALTRWEASVAVFEENISAKMSLIDIQLSHAQVLQRSSFCRRVLSACFMLERVEGLTVENQWENFVFSMGPEGWRARIHIYSPGTKPGGGPQHRPGLSRNGCYLVRLFHLGAWRCVWVSDQVPVDATDSPLLPFSPLLSYSSLPKPGSKQVPTTVNEKVVYIWPLLLCKALLKLAAPEMNSDEEPDSAEDEMMPEFNILHALTGAMNIRYDLKNIEDIWHQIITEVQLFSWDDDNDTTVASTVKTRSSKRPTTKENTFVKRGSFSYLIVTDTKNCPPFALPGVTPGHEMSVLVAMARDLPLKKPLPGPDLPLWKYYRWVDWARSHRLLDEYECPRTRFVKVNGLMKLSYAPHLLDVQSTESITHGYRNEHDRTPIKKIAKDVHRYDTATSAVNQHVKEELREWIRFEQLHPFIKELHMVFYPSMYQTTSAASNPLVKTTKSSPYKATDIPAPKSAPLYLQIDGPDKKTLRISLTMLHPRLLSNSGIITADYIEPAYLALECFEWFTDYELVKTKAFVRTRGYDSLEVKFRPGRHFCRIWVHSRMNWHILCLSQSSLVLGTRDIIQAAAAKECPWASRFLLHLSVAFMNWIRINRSTPSVVLTDREFYRSYEPDLPWEEQLVGYKKSDLHWMFRQALQSLLKKRLQPVELSSVCAVFRRYFCDPDFGLPEKPKPLKSLKEIVEVGLCYCLMPDIEEIEFLEEHFDELINEPKPKVNQKGTARLQKQQSHANAHFCGLEAEEVPCGIPTDEREKIIRRHEAATRIQASWRGKWARKCLKTNVNVTPEFIKCVMDNAFGNIESLSALMNEFFRMYPGAKHAYSVASGLGGVYGLQQFHSFTQITSTCKWVPYFQGVFYCHGHVKVHFDVQSPLQYSTVAVFNNDSGEQLPQAYNAHITFDIAPNLHGYTVMGHGTLNQPLGHNNDCHWQLTVLSSVDGHFHICDNDLEQCKEQPLPSAHKLHVNEIYVPNRRNILGGIQILVTKHESVSFRAAATSSDLDMVAILKTISKDGTVSELDRCSGKGELYWPYIRLEPMPPPEVIPKKNSSYSQSNINTTTRASKENTITSARSLKAPPKSAKSFGKAISTTRMKEPKLAPIEVKRYFIEVTAPQGWPLTIAQWKRVEEVRNSSKKELQLKKPSKEKSARDKEKLSSVKQPRPGDAYVELECSMAIGGGATGKRDDRRDLEFAAARKAWDAGEPGRNLCGAQIRMEFRAEFLETLAPAPSETEQSLNEELFISHIEGEQEKVEQHQGPTPTSQSAIQEMSTEAEEESKYLSMPEQLKDKFLALYFVPFCMKEKENDECAIMTPDMAEAAKNDRQARIELSQDRMCELQLFNEVHVLGRQKNRCLLLERLFVDSQWSPELENVLLKRDEVIAQETLKRNLSATKKKQEEKKGKKKQEEKKSKKK